MGHASYHNLSDFLVKYLYAKGKVSIKMAVENFQKRYPEDGVRASEGVYTDEFMLAMAFEEIIGWWQSWSDGRRGDYRTPDTPNPIVVPVNLTDKQKDALRAWDAGNLEDTQDWTDFDNNRTHFDTILWSFGPGWRKKYPDIPKLGNVTH